MSYFGSSSALYISRLLIDVELTYGYVSIVFTLWFLYYYGQSAEAITMHVYTCFRDSIKKDVSKLNKACTLSSNVLLTFWVIENH